VQETIKTNITGTTNIVNAAIENRVKKVIDVSSDKAVEPINLYGMTRRVAVFTYLRGGSPNRHQIGAQIVQEAGKMLFKIHSSKITHGDYSKRNVLFYKGKVSGVIDLEYGKSKAGKKAIYDDLAKSVCLWCMSVTLKNINVKDRVLFFLKGYWGNNYSQRKVKKIIPAIIKALDKEEEIHHEIYGGEGQGFGIIRKEIAKISKS
jgi:Ser/Thr protein kinase RdoA (MazF antagonist)